MKPNKRLIIGLILLLLAFIALSVFLISKYKAEQSKQDVAKKADEIKKAPLPYINTSELPSAKVGAKYQSEVFATLTNANESLLVTATGLPDGLTLGKCSQEFDSKISPTPNTLTKCVIEGIPTKDGLYQIKVSAANKNDYTNTVEQTIDLVVEAS